MEEVGVLFEGKSAVGIGWQDVVRVDDDDAVRFQQGAETLAIEGEKIGIDGFVTHG